MPIPASPISKARVAPSLKKTRVPDVWQQFFQKTFHVGFSEDHNIIHAAKCGNKPGTRVFFKDGATRAFEIADAGIGIHTNDENVASAPGAFEIANVSNMKRIKTSVCTTDALAVALVFGTLLPQF